MAVPEDKLFVSEEIAGGDVAADFIVPAVGKIVRILEFYGDAAFTQNSVVRLVWDMEGPDETQIWTIKGEGSYPLGVVVLSDLFPALLSDGVRKLGVCCENGESGPLFMSGYARVLVE